jgi:membrane protease YdiL (CAAX protease family)
MSKEALLAGGECAGCTRSGSYVWRAAAILEVLFAFSLVHLGYRSFKHFTKIGSLEGASGLNFSPGMVMILFPLMALAACRRDLQEYGLTLKGWQYNLNVGLLWGVLIVLAAGMVIQFRLVHFDPLHPPDLTRAVVFSSGETILIILLVVFLMRERSLVQRIPSLVSLFVLFVLVSLPVILVVLIHRDVPNVVLQVLWLFFGAGFGEEVFFRGYIQSRVNHSFGRPWRVLDLQFGVGLIVSSLLFGFIHALNTVDYFSGRYDFAWLWWGTNFVTGLFFGCLREKTGSILPGAIIHGVQDVLAMIPALLS